MLFRFNINRITLLMQYFIERLGNHSTSFTARSYTCTWCGCLYSVLRGGFGIAPFRPSASDFHGSLTIANSVLKATTKVTCGVAHLLSATTMRLVYIPPLFGTQRIGESNSAACIFENTPKGALLPFGITALRERRDSNPRPTD